MSTYKQRTRDQAKTILVNPLGYANTLEIGHKFKMDTAVKQDLLRITIASALTEHVDTCAGSCGDVRREVVSIGAAILLGQAPDYYTRKKQMFVDTIAAAQVVLSNWDDVIVGIIPDFSTVTATVVPKTKSTPEA